jgi:hypothetical protein
LALLNKQSEIQGKDSKVDEKILGVIEQQVGELQKEYKEAMDSGDFEKALKLKE